MIDKVKLKKSNEWFNEGLWRLRNKVAKSKRKFDRKKSERNWSEFTELQKEYKMKCAKIKQISVNDFIEKIKDIKTMANLHKKLTNPKGNNIASLIKKDNTRTIPGEDTLEELIRTHFPKSQPKLKTNYPNTVKTTQEVNSTAENWINFNLIKLAMLGFKIKKIAWT